MKKNITLIVALCIASVAMSMSCDSIKITPTNPYSQQFEDTTNRCWVRDTLVGTTHWTYDKGNSIKQEYSGYLGKYNLLYYQGGRGHKGRLVSPILDLSALSNPVLSLRYINKKWSSDIDTMLVLVRNASYEEWQTLLSTSSNVDQWTTIDIPLGTLSSTTQVAIEVHSGYGYGVGIDTLAISEMLELTAPVIGQINTTHTTAECHWTASLLADSTEIVLSYDQERKQLVKRLATNYTMCTFNKLVPNTSYYFSARSWRGQDTTEWVTAPVYIEDVMVGVSTTVNCDSAHFTFGQRNLLDHYDFVYSDTALSDSLCDVMAKSIESNQWGVPTAHGKNRILYVRGVYTDYGKGPWYQYNVSFYKSLVVVDSLVVSESDAFVHWKPFCNEDGWKVIVSDADTLQENTLNAKPFQFVDSCHYRLNNLVANKRITVYIAPALVSANWTKISFKPADHSPVEVTDTTAFEDSFEDGFSRWTLYQEKLMKWIVAEGTLVPKSSYPYYHKACDSAFEGKQNLSAACLSNEGGEADLISPQMDISKLSNPVLRFRLVQNDWGGDIDTLRVYYSPSPSQAWVKIYENSEPVTEWQQRSLPLPEASANYRVMFRAVSGYGYGIGIDNVSVRSLLIDQVETTTSSTPSLVVNNGMLYAKDIEGLVQVYTLTGMLVGSAQGPQASIALPRVPALYLVRANGKIVKILAQ